MAGGLMIPPPKDVQDNCALCCDHFRPLEDQQRNEHLRYTKLLSDEEAQLYIQNLLYEIDNNRTHVTARLATHGDLIVTRWAKKSKEKRATLLSSVAPHVFGEWPRPPLTKSDFGVHTEVLKWIDTEHLDAIPIAEWLEIIGFIEDRMRLLALLHVRTAYSPAAWAGFDIRSAMAFGFRQLQVPFSPRCVKICGTDYGRLVDYSEEYTHSWAYVGFPLACSMLLTQYVIMEILKRLTDRIIDDASASGDTKWRGLVADGFRGSGCEALWGAYIHAAFGPPVCFDPKVMLLKAKARYDLTLDELELMQTQPNYMHQVVKDRKGSLICENGVSTKVIYDNIAMDVVAELMTRLVGWLEVVMELQSIRDIFKNYSGNITAGQPLAAEVNLAMVSLGSLLNDKLKGLSYVFDRLLPSMRTFRERFTPYDDGVTLLHREKPVVDSENACNRLYWLVYKLKFAVAGGSLIGVSCIFRLIQDTMLNKMPTGMTETIDKRLFDQLTDIATMDELRQMWVWSQMQRPRQYDEKALEAYRSRVYGTDQVMKTPIILDKTCQEKIGRRLKHFVEAPWPKGKKNLAWLVKATESRKRLSRFWQAIREESRRVQLSTNAGINLVDGIESAISFDTDLAYLQELEIERKACEEESRLEAQAASALRARSAQELIAYQELTGSNDDSGPTKRKKTKAKAARDAFSQQDLSPPEERLADLHIAAASDADSAPSAKGSPIPVKQDSLSVFHRMCPTDATSAQGTVKWTQFTHAMTDAGFTAIEASESAVNFTIEAGSIAFHRPHPEPTIEPITLHCWARRMHRRFGWNRDLFVLREKAS